MAQWVLSVAGIAILSVLADVILPAGQTKKYIKTVIGVVVTLVLVQPIFSFAGGDGNLFDVDGAVEPQEQYISYVEDQAQDGVSALTNQLKLAGFDNPSVVFVARSRQFLVTLSEDYRDALHDKAVEAVNKAKCKYPVKFVWNNTGQL